MPYPIADDQYSAWTGLVYIFNLIVGTGALTLPAAFLNAGWCLGVILIISLAFMSYVTTTFVLEAMSCANAIAKFKTMQQLSKVSEQLLSETIRVNQDSEIETDDSEDQNEGAPLFPSSIEVLCRFPSQPSRFYTLSERIEMGEMANMVFSHLGKTLFFLCFVLYLYGDLAIYSAVISKSLGDIICTYEPNINRSCGDNLPPQTKCWENFSMTRISVYRILIAAFITCLGPFAFFNVQKTKYLQVFTSILRWLAFTIMIVLALKVLIEKGAQAHPAAAHYSGLPALLGASVYSFMCHHSIPGLIAPIAGKSQLYRLLAFDYILISCFYLLLALTGVFAFPQLDEIYTLVFNPRCSTSGVEDTALMRFIGYFLALFPVFTLSTSFPIIAITLRSNLQNLFLGNNTSAYPWAVQHMCFPLMAVVPPVLVALISENLEILVRVTGSFAGVGIQYVIPAVLVYITRNEAAKLPLGDTLNPFASPFRATFWVVLVLLWALVSVLLVLINLLDS